MTSPAVSNATYVILGASGLMSVRLFSPGRTHWVS
jgi:hypothetical protein